MDATLQKITRLWDELAELGPRGCNEAIDLVLRRMCELIDAQQGYWIGAARVSHAPQDPLRGWRPRAVHYLHDRTVREENYQQQVRRLEAGVVDPSIAANVRGAGTFRVNIGHQLVDPSWFESEYYKRHFAPLGIQDTIFVATPVSEDMESWFGFQRINHESFFFGEEEREALLQASRSMKWFHRQVALRHGLLLAEHPVTRAERRVLDALLTEKTEKEIADELHLSPATVHTYAMRIYKKFGVRGRLGLTAVWLGRTES